MGQNTRIEWADHTFNPWIGCTKVSPACDHCYAETLATARLGVAWGPHAERRRTAPSTWNLPLRWNRQAERERRRYRVFCASLADVFDNAAPIEWLVELLDLVRITPTLDWLLLTKRPQLILRRLQEAFDQLARGIDRGDLIAWLNAWLHGAPPAHVWLGTTVENQAEADRRIPHLLAVPAAKRFLSMEPLLGPVDLTHIAVSLGCTRNVLRGTWSAYPITSAGGRAMINTKPPAERLDWIIAGGESGPQARPSHPDWFRSLRDQCQAAGVPFFFKQVGEFEDATPSPDNLALQTPSGLEWRGDDGADMLLSAAQDHRGEPMRLDGRFWASGDGRLLHRTGKKAAGALLDGREWREVPA